jgi:hypothetical protein
MIRRLNPLFAVPVLIVPLLLVMATPARGQLTPYNPYADSQEAPAPLAADGTVQWGVFYKSNSVQSAYQRLWNLGACRGTNKAITEPVNRNKMIIDRLPEADFQGTVVAATGGLAGGLVAFSEGHAVAAGHAGATAEPLVAQLHPAGVTRLRVTGRVPAAVLRPGLVLRLVAEVDERGRAAAPLTAFEVVTPQADFKPDPVRPRVREMIVGTVKRIHKDVVTLEVPAGTVRRLTFTISPDAVATVDAARLDLVAAGDAITVTGRLWAGEGAMGAGTVFVSDVTITKPALPGEVALPAAAGIAARP